MSGIEQNLRGSSYSENIALQERTNCTCSFLEQIVSHCLKDEWRSFTRFANLNR